MAPGQEWFDTYFIGSNFYEVLAQIPAERTDREVAFIVTALGLPNGARILDLCCGVGRHTIALARQGYIMDGLDLDPNALRLANERAKDAGVSAGWHHADMRDIPFKNAFDGVINLFSSFGYYETDEEDAKVLAGVARTLKPDGVFLLDIGNRERFIHPYHEHAWDRQPDGVLILTERELDLVTGRHRVTDTFVYPDGRRRERWHQFRFYALSELVTMLRVAGLAFERAWGDFDGSAYGLDSPRIIVLARKPG